ncbi:hypothetical protein [Microbispora sp. GKU 823]|uniref:hypothetical protein n=1 Tax=Microbispora sp. GKU 823 TaxID=1652100 RepID=UPI0009A4319F|nr:hypothetical protein [Microbispora sp. GKU 823]OPG13699.1 hypothetical protein B1L11_06850 [Microbispora sp. GKU 823]
MTIIQDAPQMRTHLDALHQQGYDLDIKHLPDGGFTIVATRTTEITVTAGTLDEALALTDAQAPGSVDRVFAALGEYAWRFECASHLRSMLLAALIAGKCDIDPAQIVDLARDEPFNERVREAGREADRLLAEARRRWEAAEYGEATLAEGQVARG